MIGPAPEETLLTIEIDVFYELTGRLAGWDEARVNKLCRMMGCTVFELGKLAGVSIQQTRKYVEKKQWPPPVCLHFSMIEDNIMQRAFGRPPKIIMPLHVLDRAERRIA